MKSQKSVGLSFFFWFIGGSLGTHYLYLDELPKMIDRLILWGTGVAVASLFLATHESLFIYPLISLWLVQLIVWVGDAIRLPAAVREHNQIHSVIQKSEEN